MRRSAGIALAMLLMMGGCGDDTTEDRRPVILDYSPTVSDIGALAFVASHPDLELLAVTLPGRGESFCAQGVAHTRGVLIELGLEDVPVACSESDLPLEGFNSFPVDWSKAANALALPEGDPNEERFAAELIIDTVRTSLRPVEILAVGPLTNLAVAFEMDPSLPGRLDGVTIMGGAVDVPGNVFANEYAEWNIWVDPAAAARVFSSGVDLTVVPLDATNFLPASQTLFDALDQAASGPAATIVRDLIAADPFWLAGGFYFWDELAAAVLADESIVEFEPRTLAVVISGAEEGRVVADPSGGEARVAVSADRASFEQLYIDTLVGTPVDLGYVDATPEEVAYFADLARIGAETQAGFDEVIGAVIEEFGLGDEDFEGEAFLDVVAVALPQILSGPWADQIEALAALEVPVSMADRHAAWLDAMQSFSDAESEVLAALAEGFEGFDLFFAPVAEACLALQAEADARTPDVDVDLRC